MVGENSKKNIFENWYKKMVVISRPGFLEEIIVLL